MLSWDERFEYAQDYFVPWIDRVVGLSGKRVLEFGAGTGAVAAALSPEVEPVLGLDILEPDIAIANAKAQEHGLSNIEFLAVHLRG